jgi:hypothetical protein
MTRNKLMARRLRAGLTPLRARLRQRCLSANDVPRRLVGWRRPAADSTRRCRCYAGNTHCVTGYAGKPADVSDTLLSLLAKTC